MRLLAITVIVIILALALFSAVMIVAIAWTHYPEGFLRVWLRRRKERSEHEENRRHF